MRIGLAGASCTGKTTLASTLASVFGLEVIEETARLVFPEFGISSPRELTTSAEQVRFQRRVLEVKAAAEARVVRCVADRTFVDAAAYWLYHSCRIAEDGEALEYLAQCRRLMDNYSQVFFLPYDRLGGTLVDDGVRTGKRSYNYAMHLLIEGLLRDWHISHVILHSVDAQEALDHVGRSGAGSV